MAVKNNELIGIFVLLIIIVFVLSIYVPSVNRLPSEKGIDILDEKGNLAGKGFFGIGKQSVRRRINEYKEYPNPFEDCKASLIAYKTRYEGCKNRLKECK